LLHSAPGGRGRFDACAAKRPPTSPIGRSFRRLCCETYPAAERTGAGTYRLRTVPALYGRLCSGVARLEMTRLSRGHRGSLRNSCPGTRGFGKDYSEPLQQKCDALNSVANIRFTAAWLCSPAPAYDACSCEQESGTQLEPQVACLVQDSAQGEEKPGLCTAPQFGDLVSRQRDVLTGPAIHLRR